MSAMTLHRRMEQSTGFVWGYLRGGSRNHNLHRWPLFIGPIRSDGFPPALTLGSWARAWRGSHGISVSSFGHMVYIATAP